MFSGQVLFLTGETDSFFLLLYTLSPANTLSLTENGGLPAAWGPSPTDLPTSHPSLNPYGPERQLLNAAEPLSSGLIKNHITDLVLFFFPPWLDENKTRRGGEEGRRRDRSELLNGDTQSEYLICWFYWIKGEKVVLVCCLPVKPWQTSILFPDWSFLLLYGF